MDCFLLAQQCNGLCGGMARSGFGGFRIRAASAGRACSSPSKLKGPQHSQIFPRLAHGAAAAAAPRCSFNSCNGIFENDSECAGKDEQSSASSCSTECGKLVPLVKSTLQSLSQEMAMGLVLPGGGGTGWTTGSGLEGPSGSMSNEEGKGITEINERPWPTLTKSPRRRMRVIFTCNVCGERTTRAINPHAYTDGTVFVQCKGCNVFHKLVDNLKLFHELKGHIFKGQCKPGLNRLEPYDILHSEDFPFL